MTHEIIQVNGVHYFVTAAGKGEPLILLHGFTGSSAGWGAHVSLSAKQFQVITIDILGHGRSPSPSDVNAYHMEQAAAQIIEVVQKTAVSPINLLGYSMGGRLALYIAVHYPRLVNKLILESSSPGLAAAAERDDRRQRDNDLADWIEANGIEAFVNRWEKLPMWDSQKQLSTEQRSALRRQRLSNNPIGLANSLRGMGTGAQPSLWQHLPQLNIPTLLITGELDTKFVRINTDMLSKLPHAAHEIIPGCGHTVHLERPLQFQQAVQQFSSSANQ